MSTKVTSSSAKKPVRNVRKPKTSVKSSTKQPARFASAKKSRAVSPKKPPTPVASANVNKNFRKSLRSTSKEIRKQLQSSKQTKSLIKPLSSRTRPATSRAKKSSTTTRSATSKTLARSKTEKNLQQKNARKSPKSPEKQPEQTTTESSTPKSTFTTTVVSNDSSAKNGTNVNSTKQSTVPSRGLRKPASPKKTNRIKSTSKQKSSRSPTKTANTNKANVAASLPPKSPRNVKSPRNKKSPRINNKRSPVSNAAEQPKQTNDQPDESNIIIAETVQDIEKQESRVQTKSGQFRKKLELFEQELLKAKTDYEKHVKRVAFQKTVWQNKYFNLLRIKSNDPVLNELAKERRTQILAKKQAQKEAQAAKNGTKILSPIHESETTQVQSTTTENVHTECKQLQASVELKDVEVNTENVQFELDNYNDEMINEIRASHDRLSTKFNIQRQNIICNSAAIIDEYNSLRKDVNDMKTEIKTVWQSLEPTLKTMLITELTGVSFVAKKSMEMKQTETEKIETYGIHVQTDRVENNDTTPMTTVFVSETSKQSQQKQSKIAETQTSAECWEIGTQTELTEVDSQSVQLQALVNDLNEDLIAINQGFENSSVNHTPTNNSNKNNNNSITTSGNSINTQQWFNEVADKMSQIHSFKNDLNSIKDQVSSMVTQSKMDFNHLFTSLHAIGRYNQNMKHMVKTLRTETQSVQFSNSFSHEHVTVDKFNTSVHLYPDNTKTESLTIDEMREKDFQYMTNSIDSTLQQIRDLYQATSTMDDDDHEDTNQNIMSPLVSNNTFFACDYDFKNNNESARGNNNMFFEKQYHKNALPEIVSESQTDSIDLPPPVKIETETELDGLSQNLPISKEFLNCYVEKQNFNKHDNVVESISPSSQWNSLVVNPADSVRCDDFKQEESRSESLESNIDSYVENAMKNNLDVVTSDAEMEPTNEKVYSMDRNVKSNETIKHQSYKGKLQLLQKRMQNKAIQNLKVDTNSTGELTIRPGTPISAKSTSKSISNDMVFELEHNPETIEELFEQSLMSDRALLNKIDALDTILDGLLSVHVA